MKVEQQQIGTVDVFTPVGALIDQDAERFARMLLDRLESANARAVVDLHEVPYMDSSALEGLLAASEEVADRATGLKLANVTPTCREILELTGLSNRFRFFESVQDAVKSFL
jgi:anti-anti-sigma factor